MSAMSAMSEMSAIPAIAAAPAPPVRLLARAVTGPGPAACDRVGMSPLFKTVVTAMGLGRIALGLAPLVAAGPASRMLGFPADHDNPTARAMARMFGVRDIGLGVLAFYAVLHPETAPFIFLFNAFMDAGDLAAFAVPLLRRQGIDRAALASSAFALVGGLSWLTAWLLVR